MEEEKKDKGFVVKDRRKVNEAGEARLDEAGDQKPEARVEESEGEKKAEDSGKATEQEYLPEMNFSNFVFSLSTTIMFHFGDFPDPATKKAEKNLAAAKQTIDILGMLKEKTEGNLDPDEKGLLDAVLFEMRMRYVKEKDKQ
jgi:hypothetical protein